MTFFLVPILGVSLCDIWVGFGLPVALILLTLGETSPRSRRGVCGLGTWFANFGMMRFGYKLCSWFHTRGTAGWQDGFDVGLPSGRNAVKWPNTWIGGVSYFINKLY